MERSQSESECCPICLFSPSCLSAFTLANSAEGEMCQGHGDTGTSSSHGRFFARGHCSPGTVTHVLSCHQCHFLSPQLWSGWDTGSDALEKDQFTAASPNSPRGHRAQCESAGAALSGWESFQALASSFPPRDLERFFCVCVLFFNNKAKQRNHHSGTKLGAKPQLPAHHPGDLTPDASPRGASGPNGGRTEVRRGMQHP